MFWNWGRGFFHDLILSEALWVSRVID